MRDAKRAAEYLFDEIGGIDDSYIAAAQSARRSRGATVRRTFSIAAAVAAVFMIAVLAMPALITRNFDKVSKDDSIETETVDNTADNSTNTGTQTNAPLEQLLSSTGEAFVASGDVDLFDGRAKLIWQDRQNGKRYEILLSRGQLAQIEKLIKHGKRNEQIESQLLVWVSFGDGRVVSPCLEYSDGNVGYGSLFDYLPEVVPVEELINYIDVIIRQHT